MQNPFEVINARLLNLEGFTLEVLQHLRNFSPAPADEVLNIKQAAEMLNLTTQTIYGLVSARKIPFSKPNNSRLYFSRLELMEWLKTNRTATLQEQTLQYDQQRATARKQAAARPAKS